VSKSFKEWLGEGEAIYAGLIDEFRRSEQQIVELETRVAGLLAEVNHVAAVIGKPPLDRRRAGSGALQGELVDAPVNAPPMGQPPTSANIARALTGSVAVKVL
jgi:hypothetical protein